MEYKGYHGSVHYDDEGKTFYGKVEYVRALISYEASDSRKFRKAFEEAVDDYLDMCAANDLEPERPFKGTFNVRIKPDLHRRAMLAAKRKGITLNKLVTEALEKATK